MKKSDFNTLYEAEIGNINNACAEISERLQAALKEDLDREYFRIRIREARVKDKDSLYEKIVSQKIASNEVFVQAGAVKDLIGARIVCYNIDDIYKVFSRLKESENGFYITDSVKDQIKIPDATGYRAMHFDVRFRHNDKDFQCEVQIRTLLQDAWASFMHEDVYKGPVKSIVEDQLSELSTSTSDLLLAIDKMAQSLRNYVEENPISHDIRIKTLEAVHWRMHAFLEYYQNHPTLGVYESVERVDRYVLLEEGVVRYEHTIHALTHTSAPFELIIGGDSGVDNLSNLKLTQIQGTKETEVKHLQEKVSDAVVKVKRGSNRKTKRHHFRVECEWASIFEQPIEYLFAPWGEYYSEAELDYTLEFRANGKLCRAPVCYTIDVGAEISIESLMQDYNTNGPIGEEMEYIKLDDTYRKTFKKLKQTVLCLFEPKW